MFCIFHQTSNTNLTTLSARAGIRVDCRSNTDTSFGRFDVRFRGLECLVGHNTIDVCRTSKLLTSIAKGRDVPVRIVWKAASTFEASSADVSMNDKPFSAITSCFRLISPNENRGTHWRKPLPHQLARRAGASNRSCYQPT